MSQLQDLYQEVIIDHGTKPRNQGKLEHCSHQAQGFNPLCGDELSLYLTVKDDVISDVKFESNGCAISTASASLMSQHLKNKTMAEALSTMEEFTNMVTQSPDAAHESLGKLKILAGVNKYPSRVKCATLAWHTLKAALNNEQQPISTE
jgi:nitrogen fixation NifU-like protein